MRILKITSPDICNGLGNRVTVWVAGCSHHCPHCHNQHTWDYNIGTDSKMTLTVSNLTNFGYRELPPYVKV